MKGPRRFQKGHVLSVPLLGRGYVIVRTTDREVVIDDYDLVVGDRRLEIDPDRNPGRLEQRSARIFALVDLVEDSQDFDAAPTRGSLQCVNDRQRRETVSLDVDR